MVRLEVSRTWRAKSEKVIIVLIKNPFPFVYMNIIQAYDVLLIRRHIISLLTKQNLKLIRLHYILSCKSCEMFGRGKNS